MGIVDGRVVIVTGAGGGIGRAHALAFAAEGARVAVLDRDPADDHVHVSADVTDADAIGSAVAEVEVLSRRLESSIGDIQAARSDISRHRP